MAAALRGHRPRGVLPLAPARRRDHGARSARRDPGARRMGLRVRAHGGRPSGPTLLRRPPATGAPVTPATSPAARCSERSRSARTRSASRTSSRTPTSRNSSAPTTRASAPSRSTSTRANASCSSPTPSSSRPADTRACGGAAHRDATRTSAKRSASRSTSAAPLMDMELVQFHPTAWSSPRKRPGRSSPKPCAARADVCSTRSGERYMERYDPERLELSLTRPRRARELHGDRRGTRHRARRRPPRHLTHRQGRDPREAPADVPAVHRVPDARHREAADGGRADRALHDGRARRRSRDARDRASPASTPRAR